LPSYTRKQNKFNPRLGTIIEAAELILILPFLFNRNL
jgi:hypothetical protein